MQTYLQSQSKKIKLTYFAKLIEKNPYKINDKAIVYFKMTSKSELTDHVQILNTSNRIGYSR